MEFENLFSTKKILVVGDSILDHYVYGKVHRISPEAPVPVVLKSEEEFFLGGAANVAQNITAFGAKCTLLSLTGSDLERDILFQKCFEQNINPVFIIDESRPTTKKTRVLGNKHQIVRIDHEKTHGLSLGLSLKVSEIFENEILNHDGVIFQDYGKGLLTKDLLELLIQISQKHNRQILVDPKEPDLSRYQGVSFIKPNLNEFKSMLNLKIEEELEIPQIVDYAQKALSDFDYECFLITLSERGILVVKKNFSYHVPGIRVDVSDVSGAGDTVSAVFALGIFAGQRKPISELELVQIAETANLAGSLVCRHLGAVPVDPVELFNYPQKNLEIF